MPKPTRSFMAMALVAALAAPALATSAPLIPGGDPATRPQDDYFRHVNGAWLDAAVIPGDKRSYGTFMVLRDNSDKDVRALLEAAAAKPGQDANGKLIGDFYASMLDLKALDKQGIGPLKDLAKRIGVIRTSHDLAAVLGELQMNGVWGPVAAYASPDKQDPTINTVSWTQSGLGMPDRDYYLKAGAEADALRAAYKTYLSELWKLAGGQHPEVIVPGVVALETALAEIQWARVDRRDALKTYNPTPRDRWAKDYGNFPWARFASSVGMPANLGVNVNEPTYVKAFGTLAAQTPIETWRAYLHLRMLDSYAPYMGTRFRAANHRFKGEKLNGLTTQPPAWQTAVEATSAALGEAIGERYVAKHFPPKAKARMQTLVDHLIAVYGESLDQLEWMTPATRKAAREKLANFRVKIGYPNRWRGYAGLEVKRGDGIGNLMRESRFAFKRDMAEAGKKVDRDRWHMTPQTVNAYYSPLGNEIVFPAAILQPPFFDMAGDDAYNYGAIGAVIGHEISHGFDDQGRRYDGQGRLRDWWTPEDTQGFNARAERLIAQYAAYEPLPGARVDGKLTLGENIADLAGVDMALKAYRRSLAGKAAPAKDGMTADQRFFVGYARVWRSKSRPEWLKMRLSTDSHSPEQYRTNGVLTNLDAFYDAYGLKPGDKLYKSPEERVRIW
ncbi:MAG: M13 family metallopeptidase [Candidatus Sericytochromatia bacterium]